MIAILNDERDLLERANETIRAMNNPTKHQTDELLENTEIINAIKTLLAYYGVAE